MRGRFSGLFHCVHHYLKGMEVRNIVYVVLLTGISFWWVHQFKQYILGSVELKGYDAIANYSKQTEILYHSFTLLCSLFVIV